jgi:hypothetical protein
MKDLEYRILPGYGVYIPCHIPFWVLYGAVHGALADNELIYSAIRYINDVILGHIIISKISESGVRGQNLRILIGSTVSKGRHLRLRIFGVPEGNLACPF